MTFRDFHELLWVNGLKSSLDAWDATLALPLEIGWFNAPPIVGPYPPQKKKIQWPHLRSLPRIQYVVYRVQLRSFHLLQPPNFQWDMSPGVAVEPTDVKQYIVSGKFPAEGWKWGLWWKNLTQSPESQCGSDFWAFDDTSNTHSVDMKCVSTMCHLHQSHILQPFKDPTSEVACNSLAQAFLSKASKASKSEGSARRIRKVLRCKCWFSIRQ